jgi:hypothetical protein
MKAPRPQSTYEPIEAGSYPARCYSIVELGTIQPHNPNFAPTKKIRITWELPTVLGEFMDGDVKVEKPRIISGEYTFSMHKRGKLRPTIEGWFGKSFPNDDAAYDFDLEKLIGKSCLIAVQNDEKDGNVYSNISGILPLPKGIKCPSAVNAPFFLSYESWDQEAFESLPQFIKDKIIATPEYKGINCIPIERSNTVSAASEDEIDIEEIPF